MADASKLLANLAISVHQISTSPATLGISVSNNNSVPVTFLTWDSPLDPLVLQLGALSITPSGSSTELDIPQIKVARRTPPGEESLVELAAGATSEENVVELKEMIVGKQLREQGASRATLRCRGMWRAVWAEKKESLGAEKLELMGGDDDAASGEFETEAVEITVE